VISAPSRRLSDEARELVRNHPWPGNVRQLENTIRRLLVTASETEISAPRWRRCWAASRCSPSR
jgi:DNA-binding NtrC family response regulator